MNITIAVNVSGVMDADDKRAMISRIIQINAGRVTPLKWDTNANIKASYETILSEAATSLHNGNIDNSVATTGLELAGFSEADRQAVRKKLIDLVQGGQPVATVLGKVASLS